MARTSLSVIDGGVEITFGIDDLMRYHGPRSPGGVAIAYKALELALPRLGSPPDRRSVTIRTAFAGPGARDGFEMALRAVSEDRYVVDPSIARPSLGRARERFVFEFNGSLTLVLRDGFVTDEFVDLARRERTPAEEAHLDVLKRELAERVLARPADEVYDLDP